MKKKGFTYIEVMIAFAIFALIFTFVMKLNRSSNVVMRDERQRLKMIYVAQRSLENFKTVLLDSEDNNVEGFYVLVKKTDISSTLKEVTVTVKKNKNDSLDKAVILKSRVLAE